MSITYRMEAHEWNLFSVPHGLCVAGELLHMIGSGTLTLASTLRLHMAAQDVPGPFALRLGGGRRDETGRLPAAGPDAAAMAARWEGVLPRVLGLDADALEGLMIEADFGPLWRICPAQSLGASPALAVGLVVAVLSHRGASSELAAEELARLACRLRAALVGADEGTDAFYGEALASVAGGVGWTVPGESRLNMQEMLPPESMLLALSPSALHDASGWQGEARLRAALARAQERGFSMEARGDQALAALFALSSNGLTEEEMTMLYGLARERELAEGFIERLDNPLLDNDLLAEMCDEESTLLADYFGFPGIYYEGIRQRAVQAGALGTKLTWAFGGSPAALLLAPGRRSDVGQALKASFPQVQCLLVNPDATGLFSGEDEEDFDDEGDTEGERD